MLLIPLLYMILASSFTVGKALLFYLKPFFLLGLRMTVAGTILLFYQYWRKPSTLSLHMRHWFLFAQLVVFHIYCAYALEFWALQYISSAKTALLYSLSPFLTVFFAYLALDERMTQKKWFGLFIGVFGLLPVLYADAPQEQITGEIMFFSTAEIALLIGICCAAYGWIVMKQLTYHKGYSPLTMNGFAMFVGGILLFASSFLLEGWPTITHSPETDIPFITSLFSAYISAPVVMVIFYLLCLILVANIIFYNLYSYLLHHYSATFLSFSGFTCPLFAALFGWFFLGEQISLSFFITVVGVSIGLIIFYQEELKKPIIIE